MILTCIFIIIAIIFLTLSLSIPIGYMITKMEDKND